VTIPYYMNCEHSESGWCLECVASLYDQLVTTEQEAERISKRLWRLKATEFRNEHGKSYDEAATIATRYIHHIRKNG
jgi:hypothetical protein